MKFGQDLALPYPHPHSNPNSNAKPDSHADGDSDSDSCRNSRGYLDARPHRHSPGRCIGNADAHPAPGSDAGST